MPGSGTGSGQKRIVVWAPSWNSPQTRIVSFTRTTCRSSSWSSRLSMPGIDLAKRTAKRFFPSNSRCLFFSIVRGSEPGKTETLASTRAPSSSLASSGAVATYLIVRRPSPRWPTEASPEIWKPHGPMETVKRVRSWEMPPPCAFTSKPE